MTDQEKRKSLFYSEKEFRSYEKLLLTKLIADDRSNASLLSAKYANAQIPKDPVRSLIESLTAPQNAAFTAIVAAHADDVPSKLAVLEDPVKAFDTVSRSRVRLV